MAIYRPRLVPQDDGSYWQWENCMAASGATALDRHTLGGIRTTGAKIRNCQDDKVGGIDLIDVKTAWNRCFSKYFDVRLKITWRTFVGAIKAGRGAVVAGNYAYIPYKYRGQKSPSNFGHAVYINEIRSSDGAMLMYDPLAEKPVWIPQTYIRQFAGHFRTSTGLIGLGYAQAGFTRITPTPLPDTSTSSLRLRYGGVKITPNIFAARVSAKQRRSPYIRSDNIIRVVSKGTKFKAYQKTKTGTNVGGSRIWYGNINGTVWMHSSVLRDI